MGGRRVPVGLVSHLRFGNHALESLRPQLARDLAQLAHRVDAQTIGEHALLEKARLPCGEVVNRGAEVIARVASQEPGQFFIVGRGNEGTGHQFDMFVFQPYQPREGLAQSLAVPDVHWLSLRPQMEGLIVPSKYYGIAAAGRGAIVVASPQGELGALVSREGGGVAVEPGDAEGLARTILSLEQDREACAALGRKARENLDARYTKASSLGRWRALLERVAAA